MAAAQNEMRVGVAVGFQQRRVAQRVDAEMSMGMRGRAHRIAGDGQAAVGAVLEAHRQVQPADQLAVDLRLAGARADRGPAKQIVEVAGRHRLQQLGGQRQSGFEDVQHQSTRQAQALGHVAAAVQMRIVEQAFPANGGAWLLHIGAHDQQQLVAQLRCQRGETFGVFQRGDGVMQGTGADDDQQAWVAAIEHGADGVAIGVYTCGKRVR